MMSVEAFNLAGGAGAASQRVGPLVSDRAGKLDIPLAVSAAMSRSERTIGNVGNIVGSDDLKRLIWETVVSNPTHVYPRDDDGNCLYRSEAVGLCLIGHVLVNRLDFRYDPAWEGREPPNLLLDLGFDKDAAAVARRWQDDPDKPVVQWGTLLV